MRVLLKHGLGCGQLWWLSVGQRSKQLSSTSINIAYRHLSTSHKTQQANRQRVTVCHSAQEALDGIEDGHTVMVGGFGVCGIPGNLLRQLAGSQVRDLTVVSCTGGMADCGVGELVTAGIVKRLVTSYIGENNVIFDKFLGGQLEVELVPQGTLAERIRAAGAGIPAFYTPTGFGTMVHQGGVPMKYADGGKTVALASSPKESREFNGRGFVLEEAIHADFALVKGFRADTNGNVVFRRTASNYNPIIAKAAKHVVVEVEEIVEAGQLEGEHIQLPSVYVDRIIKGNHLTKRIEKLIMSKSAAADVGGKASQGPSSRDRIILRAARELRNASFVNLGIGIPVLAANHLPKDAHVKLHGENGIMGLGPYPATDGDVDPDLTNAGKETVTAVPGASYFSSEESFVIIRGGHLDLTMLGGMQVSQNGDIANWIVPGQKVTGMGGAMDLVASAAAGTRVVVTMEHNAKDGGAKVVRQCSLPLTGQRCVQRIITEKAVFDVREGGGLTLIEVARGLTVDDIRKCTDADFEVSPDLKCMEDP